MGTSQRSASQWEQDGFVCLDHTMPTVNIHKNLSLPDALRIAQALGCRMTHRNDNDIIVGHELVADPIRPVPVSMSRRDTSQGLVAYLRRVVEATQKYRDDNPDKIKRKIEVPDPAPAKVDFSIATRITPPEARHTRVGADEICKHFSQVLEAIYYRDHADMTDFVPFSECTLDVFRTSRKMLEKIRLLERDRNGAEAKLASMEDQLGAERRDLQERRASAEKEIAEAKAEAIREVEARNRPQSQLALKASRLLEIENDADMMSLFLELLHEMWGGAANSRTSTRQLISHLAATNNTMNAGIHQAIRDMDFDSLIPAFRKAVLPGNARASFGYRAQRDFEHAVAEIRRLQGR